MKSKRFAQYVCAAILAFGFGLNIQNALTGYGISKGTTSITAEGGSNSGSNGGTNGSTNGNSNGSSPQNGKVSVVKQTHTCYASRQTDITQPVTLTDPLTQEVKYETLYWFEYVEITYYDCESVDYDKVGWRPLCQSPSSYAESGCTMKVAPPDYNIGGFWIRF